jgi:hypothetical protein
MKIRICKNDEYEAINHCKEYNYKVVVIDNIIIKETIDYRFYRDLNKEKIQFEKYNRELYIFKKKPKNKIYYYDRILKKQIVLSSKNDYLFIGKIKYEIVKKVKYNENQDVYYCDK